MPLGFDIMAQARDAIGASLPEYVRTVSFRGLRSGPRPVAIVVKCVVMPDGYIDPLLDTAPDTSIKRTALKFPLADWTDETPPQIGERVVIGGVDYFVDKVERRLAHWHIIAREGEQ